MNVEILTKEDLQKFKSELVAEITDLLKTNSTGQNQWLRSPEVRELLKISSGTLQTLRTNGTLRHSKVGGTIYYDFRDIEKLMQPK